MSAGPSDMLDPSTNGLGTAASLLFQKKDQKKQLFFMHQSSLLKLWAAFLEHTGFWA
jgi:hypothetical protein